MAKVLTAGLFCYKPCCGRRAVYLKQRLHDLQATTLMVSVTIVGWSNNARDNISVSRRAGKYGNVVPRALGYTHLLHSCSLINIGNEFLQHLNPFPSPSPSFWDVYLQSSQLSIFIESSDGSTAIVFWYRHLSYFEGK